MFQLCDFDDISAVKKHNGSPAIKVKQVQPNTSDGNESSSSSMSSDYDTFLTDLKDKDCDSNEMSYNGQVEDSCDIEPNVDFDQKQHYQLKDKPKHEEKIECLSISHTTPRSEEREQRNQVLQDLIYEKGKKTKDLKSNPTTTTEVRETQHHSMWPKIESKKGEIILQGECRKRKMDVTSTSSTRETTKYQSSSKRIERNSTNKKLPQTEFNLIFDALKKAKVDIPDKDYFSKNDQLSRWLIDFGSFYKNHHPNARRRSPTVSFTTKEIREWDISQCHITGDLSQNIFASSFIDGIDDKNADESRTERYLEKQKIMIHFGYRPPKNKPHRSNVLSKVHSPSKTNSPVSKRIHVQKNNNVSQDIPTSMTMVNMLFDTTGHEKTFIKIFYEIFLKNLEDSSEVSEEDKIFFLKDENGKQVDHKRKNGPLSGNASVYMSFLVNFILFKKMKKTAQVTKKDCDEKRISFEFKKPNSNEKFVIHHCWGDKFCKQIENNTRTVLRRGHYSWKRSIGTIVGFSIWPINSRVPRMNDSTRNPYFGSELSKKIMNDVFYEFVNQTYHGKVVLSEG